MIEFMTGYGYTQDSKTLTGVAGENRTVHNGFNLKIMGLEVIL